MRRERALPVVEVQPPSRSRKRSVAQRLHITRRPNSRIISKVRQVPGDSSTSRLVRRITCNAVRRCSVE
ncbi:hypothetical protein [Streptomyces camelliae]|uniref:Uncharacterized protein n=1 Tax=Streptomyces camelliae TaxID=3004093 RepID=A0ABY7PGK0_9ACTN|nr:hypothetical protein [Streptomyces sp. HUAS 2-6]WBO69532.1 hypothetical protein O1G22_40275 [Streptomyces sp. HUAS 2-6]